MGDGGPEQNYQWREALGRATPVVRAVEFGLSVACILAAWASSDMTLAAPALLIGWVFASVGICTNQNLSNLRALRWCAGVFALFFLIGAFLNWHFQHVSGGEKQSQVELIDLALGSPINNNFPFNLEFQNKGALRSERGLVVSVIRFYGAPLNQSECSKVLDNAEEEISNLADRVENGQISYQPTEVGYVTTHGMITQQNVQQVIGRKGSAYIFADAYSYDKSLWPWQYRVTRKCAYFYGAFDHWVNWGEDNTSRIVRLRSWLDIIKSYALSL